MNNIKIAFPILMLILSCLGACKKKSDDVASPTSNSYYISGGGGGGNTNSVLDFFINNITPSQSFVINLADSNASFTGARGTYISFPKKGLLLQGQVYTGDIRIKLIEIKSQTEMIESNKTSVTTNGKALITSGELFLNATTLDGQPLQLKDSSIILIKIPIDSALQSGMTYFSGLVDTSSNVNWIRSNPDTAKPFTGNPIAFDSTWYKNIVPVFYYNSSQYIFTVNQLGWISCAKFWNIPSKINIAVKCISPATVENTKVFVSFKHIKSAAGCYNNGTAFMANGIPSGYTATIFAISYKDGKEYYGIKDTAATSNINLNLTLVQSPEDSIKSALALKFP